MYNQIFEFLDYLYQKATQATIPTCKPQNLPVPKSKTEQATIIESKTETVSLDTEAPETESAEIVITPIYNSEKGLDLSTEPTQELSTEQEMDSIPTGEPIPITTEIDKHIPLFSKKHFSPIDFLSNFFIKKIKTLVLLHKDTIIKVGEGILPAPIGVDIDSKTGNLTVPVEVVPVGEIVLNPKIVKNLLVNEGFLKIKLISYSPDPEPCLEARKCTVKETTIPVHSIHKIKGICPDDIVHEKVEIKSISVMAIPDDTEQTLGTKLNLVIKVILEVKLSVLREEIISVLSVKN